MRLVNVFAALSGVLALFMLVIAAHVLNPAPEDAERIHLGAFIQLIAAVTGLVLAGRSGMLNAIAAAMILGGAALFSATLYALAITHDRSFVMLAPVGGTTLILGWLVLAAAKPGRT